MSARSDSTGRLEDIDEAIRLGYAAVQAAPPGDAGQWAGLNNAGIALKARFDRAGQTKDAVAALEAWQQTAAMATAPVSYRIPAARSWGQMAARLGRWRDAAEAHSTAVCLLPLLTWQGVSRASREHLLNSCARLAADAAACAIAARQPRRAVELLEQGRAVLWSQLLDTHTDLTALRDAAPVLAARVEQVRRALDRPDQLPGSGSVTVTADGRMALARQWDDLITQVRALPGFAEFARPPNAATLTRAVTGGTVIIVNVSLWRCDALLITAGRIRVVPLPGLTIDGAVGCAMTYLNALLRFEEARGDPKTAQDELEQELTEILAWLWDLIAEPVLAACGPTSAPDRPPRSRVWWCPTGPLALLPLHAAGHHDPADLPAGRNVLDKVISSYTPTLRALSQSQVRPVPDRPGRMLLITLPDTPGQPALPYVSEEQALLSSIFTDTQRTDLAGAAATRGAIMAGLAAHNWAHIACHGTQNLGDPSTGGLVPYDWLTEGFVTVTDISAGGSANGDFIFLAACKTATTGTSNFDEIITLAAGLHYTGWRHVIATLWSIWDNAAADISRELYPRLVHDGGLDPASAAEALHHAVIQCRARYPRRPSQWAPFIHIGP